MKIQSFARYAVAELALLLFLGFCYMSAQAADYIEPQAPRAGELERLATTQFAKFGKAMGIAATDLQRAKVRNYGTWVMVSNDQWVFTVDAIGNRTFRPLTYLSNFLPALSKPSNNPFVADTNSERIITIAQQLASKLNCDQAGDISETIVKKRLLAFSECGGRMNTADGGYLALLRGKTSPQHFFVLFNQSLKPIRIETIDILTPDVLEIKYLFIKLLSSSTEFAPLPDASFKMSLGAFFCGEEERFTNEAKSYLGLPYDLPTVFRNPFNQANQPKEYWPCLYWALNGGVNAVRGNWDNKSNSWQKSNVQVVEHRLEGYKVPGGPDSSVQIGSRFYNDLEANTANVFCTHGGAIRDRVQFGIGNGQWFALGNAKSKLGSGNQRHLFLQTCGNAGLVRENKGLGYQPLRDEWMNAKFVDGLRTVCGFDGVAVGIDRDGWRFFGRYNKGEPIEMSWAIAQIYECNGNFPVTIAYGDTLDEAVATLADGRFETGRVTPKYSVASIYRDMDLKWDPATMTRPPDVPENAMWLDTFDCSKITQSWGEAHPRASVTGNPLQVASKNYQQGIGTHAESKFAIALKGAATRFTATVGSDDNDACPQGSITFEVWVDNRLAERSPLMYKGQSFVFNVNLTGAKMLGLRVTDGGDGITCDAADWCDALLYLDPKATEKPEAVDLE